MISSSSLSLSLSLQTLSYTTFGQSNCSTQCLYGEVNFANYVHLRNAFIPHNNRTNGYFCFVSFFSFLLYTLYISLTIYSYSLRILFFVSLPCVCVCVCLQHYSRFVITKFFDDSANGDDELAWNVLSAVSIA